MPPSGDHCYACCQENCGYQHDCGCSCHMVKCENCGEMIFPYQHHIRSVYRPWSCDYVPEEKRK